MSFNSRIIEGSTSTSPVLKNHFPEEEEKTSSTYEKGETLKLQCSQVFDKMRPLVCSINSALGESSGFFIDRKGTILP